jgi:hypothetical protein
MSPENQRLQVQYSHVFDFHNFTQHWLDIFVRWSPNNPVTEHSSPEDENQSEPCEDPEHRSELVAHDLTAKMQALLQPLGGQLGRPFGVQIASCKPEQPTLELERSTLHVESTAY